jgi:hypothetical protein
METNVDVDVEAEDEAEVEDESEGEDEAEVENASEEELESDAAACPVYGNEATFKRVGNNRVSYDCVWVAKEHLSSPSQWKMAENQADVAMTKATACAFANMHDAAKKAGVTLTIASYVSALIW